MASFLPNYPMKTLCPKKVTFWSTGGQSFNIWILRRTDSTHNVKVQSNQNDSEAKLGGQRVYRCQKDETRWKNLSKTDQKWWTLWELKGWRSRAKKSVDNINIKHEEEYLFHIHGLVGQMASVMLVHPSVCIIQWPCESFKAIIWV